MKTQQRNTIIYWVLGIATFVGLLCFFWLCYPYHLRHREQTILFLSNWDWISTTYLTQPRGGVVRLGGDWLQQYFYYIGAGPAIVAALLTMLGAVWFSIVKALTRSIKQILANSIACVAALLLILWEGGRECLPEYPVASTLQVLGWSLVLLLWVKAKRRWIRLLALVITLCSVYLFDYGLLPQTRGYGKPEWGVEHLMALDVEASLGHWDEVERLCQEDQGFDLDVYYHNLALAQQGRLADELNHYRQYGTDGLLMPVNDKGNYFTFSAASEAWWAVGDLTMAEHATILGMIFSPRHTGSRSLKRLAEIALAKGDKAGADKYLRLLAQTAVHRDWAQRRLDNAGDGMQALQALHALQIDSPTTTDTLRLQGEARLCLRNTLDAQPSRSRIARDYLLCYDLLDKDMISFAADVEHYGCPTAKRAYEEAMLIIMSSRPEMREQWQPLVRVETFEEFQAFNHALGQSQGQLPALRKRFGNTYWYYMLKKNG